MKVKGLSESKKDRIAKKNLDLLHGHLQDVLKDPKLLDDIPNGAHVYFLPADDEEVTRYNLELARKNVAKGEKVLLLPANSRGAKKKRVLR